jgi:tetratricopeptide (TPR) repeat protein
MRSTLVILAIALLPAVSLAHDGLHQQIVTLTARIAREPNSADLYLKRAEAHRLHRMWAKAAADYDTAARLAPSRREIELARGVMLLDSGRPSPALKYLDRYVGQQHPYDMRARIVRARALAKLSRSKDAIHDFSFAIDGVIPVDLDAVLERAALMRSSGDVAAALLSLDEAMVLAGSIVALELTAIDLEIELRRFDEALERVERLAAQSPRAESWLARRGEILCLAGRSAEARRAFEAALVAIDGLPSHLQHTRATRELRQGVSVALRSNP